MVADSGRSEGQEDAAIKQQLARPLLQAHVSLERASKGAGHAAR